MLLFTVCSFSGCFVVLLISLCFFFFFFKSPKILPQTLLKHNPNLHISEPLFDKGCAAFLIRLPLIVTVFTPYEGQRAWSVCREARKSRCYLKTCCILMFYEEQRNVNTENQNVYCFPLSCHTCSGLGEGIGWTPGFEKSSTTIQTEPWNLIREVAGGVKKR